MTKVVLIDDEPGAIKSLTALISAHCPQLEIIGYAHNITDGQKLIERTNPELIFLDVNMPNGTGLELVERISHLNVEVIFTTAYQEYAIKAVRLAAVDYLLKPIDFRELIVAIERFQSKKQSNHSNYTVLKDLLDKPQKLERIALPDLEGMLIVETDKISHIEADRNYCIFHITDQGDLVISKPIGDYDKLLSAHGFMRVHRSFVINLKFVKKFNRRNSVIELTNGAEIDVSKSKKDELIERLTNIA